MIDRGWGPHIGLRGPNLSPLAIKDLEERRGRATDTSEGTIGDVGLRAMRRPKLQLFANLRRRRNTQ